MEVKELLSFIEIEDKRLREKFGQNRDEEKIILARTVKIVEEIGELCNEILNHTSLQRKEKLEKYTKEKLSEEFADVIITALLLAKSTNIEIISALENKIRKINQRYN